MKYYKNNTFENVIPNVQDRPFTISVKKNILPK